MAETDVSVEIFSFLWPHPLPLLLIFCTPSQIPSLWKRLLHWLLWERLRGRLTCKWQRKIANVDPCYVPPAPSVDVIRLHSRQEKLALRGHTPNNYIARSGLVESPCTLYAINEDQKFWYLRQHRFVRSIKRCNNASVNCHSWVVNALETWNRKT